MMGIEDKLNKLRTEDNLNKLRTEDTLNKSSTEDKLNKVKETMISSIRTPYAPPTHPLRQREDATMRA